MDRLNERELQTHISVLGWLYIVANSLFLLLAVVALGLLPLVKTFTEDPQAISVLSIFVTAFALLMILLGLPGLVAGYGLLKHKPWARVLTLVLGILGIVNFPLGTALGLYTMWVLLQQSTYETFTPHQPA